MNVEQMLGALAENEEFWGTMHRNVSVYTTDDAGRLVPVTGAEAVVQRDSDGKAHILVLRREEKA